MVKKLTVRKRKTKKIIWKIVYYTQHFYDNWIYPYNPKDLKKQILAGKPPCPHLSF